MSKVDWSLAPNWATHALVKLHNPGIGGVHWSYFIDGEHRISPDGLWFHPDGYRVAEERPRNVKPKPWSGPEDGLPPIGWLVHLKIGQNWQPAEVLAHFHGEAVLGWICQPEGEPVVECREICDLRCYRTAKELAADARETAIREIMDVADVDCRVTAARLVDAGFKRESV